MTTTVSSEETAQRRCALSTSPALEQSRKYILALANGAKHAFVCLYNVNDSSVIEFKDQPGVQYFIDANNVNKATTTEISIDNCMKKFITKDTAVKYTNFTIIRCYKLGELKFGKHYSALYKYRDATRVIIFECLSVDIPMLIATYGNKKYFINENNQVFNITAVGGYRSIDILEQGSDQSKILPGAPSDIEITHIHDISEFTAGQTITLMCNSTSMSVKHLGKPDFPITVEVTNGTAKEYCFWHRCYGWMERANRIEFTKPGGEKYYEYVRMGTELYTTL